MFSFLSSRSSSKEELSSSPEKSTATNGTGFRRRNSAVGSSTTFSISPAATTSQQRPTSSPRHHHHQQRQRHPNPMRTGSSSRSGGGSGGFSPRSTGKTATAAATNSMGGSSNGNNLAGGRRAGWGTSNKNIRNHRRSSTGGILQKNLNLDVNETSMGIEVSFLPTATPYAQQQQQQQQQAFISQSAPRTPQGGRQQQHALSPQKQTSSSLQDDAREPAPARKREAVISLKDQLRHRQRVWRSQYSLSFPALQQLHHHQQQGKHNGLSGQDGCIVKNNPTFSSKTDTTAGTDIEGSTMAQIAASNDMTSWRPKGHRIPLVGAVPVEAAYNDTLHLLQSCRVADERSAVQDELKNLEAEIAALEKDRKILERHQQNQKEKNQQQQLGSALSMFSFLQSSGSNVSGESSTIQPSESDASLSNLEWDGHKLLKDDAMQRHLLLSERERKFLQDQRGNSLTIKLDNPRTKEMFIHRCGGNLRQVQQSRLFNGIDSIVTLHPGNCQSSATQSSSSSLSCAATDLQQVELIASTGSFNGFFLARDSNRSQTWGRIPNKLYRRMQQEGAGAAGDGGGAGIGDLVYLSTGPHGSYYAEFQSGICWWGSAVEDADFHNLMRSWDVYRVAFGPIESVVEDDHANKTISTSSWIIISRDGRAAWKNLPSRLTHKLEERLASWAAPAEVSLGPGDAYFVRFLDGQVDYCLPAETARVCEKIVSRGGRITNICLHPEISNDFVIRHTDLTS